MQVKKYLVLGVLFLLPLSMYIFFASGKDNFGRLPVLTENITEIDKFNAEDNDTIRLKNSITILGFFGNDPLANKVNAFNLAHKIYKKNRGFNDFQIVILQPEGTEAPSKELKKKLSEIADTDRWKFVFGSPEEIKEVFNSLKSDYLLMPDNGSPYVFIIDKNGNLRGRDDDEDVGKLYGFDARDFAEINNKMDDDVKVILAEYRLELKKYKADREI
ncbi:MAG: hypothetical protein KJO05_07000 [Bacteroidia bacterium]|nr:hypothetical protein [Bacteroidia bacterium]NNF30560.1 hypothetical protein [Flavobacteriaceae bacterium]MBT8277106.1 hypothetical protein [Bacteroidia bacterium]NNJ83128.1 hypothetical protein [Flavobacteriaceae bacterium]NNK53119.1 hypothetical protein [Flavobacteriaceae bacterium]